MLTFCASLDAYYLYTAADEGLAFMLTCMIAAIIFDLILQVLVIIGLSITQLYFEVRRGKLLLNTDKLDRMSSEAKEIARQVFSQYEE